jgi:predicted DNA-binding transcriptional regulator AlpA
MATMLTLKEAKLLTGKSEGTLRRLIQQGTIPSEKRKEDGVWKRYVEKEALLQLWPLRPDASAQFETSGSGGMASPTGESQELVTFEEAQRLVGKSEETIRKYMKKGLIRSQKRRQDQRWKKLLNKQDVLLAFQNPLPPEPIAKIKEKKNSAAPAGARPSSIQPDPTQDLTADLIEALQTDIAEMKKAGEEIRQRVESLTQDVKSFVKKDIWNMISTILEKVNKA